MELDRPQIIRAGILLSDPRSPHGARSRLTGIVVDRRGDLFGLTTSLVTGNKSASLRFDDQRIGKLTVEKASRAVPTPIQDLFGVIGLRGHSSLDFSCGQFPGIEAPVPPFSAVGRRIIIVRYPAAPSFGTVAGAGWPITISADRKNDGTLYGGALKIRPDVDGTDFAGDGDSGALILTTDGEAVGMLLGYADGHYYGAPLKDYFAAKNYRFATSRDLRPSAREVRPAPEVGDEVRRFAGAFRHAMAAPGASEQVRSLGEDIGEQVSKAFDGGTGGSAQFRLLWRDLARPDATVAPELQRVARAFALRAFRDKRAPHLSAKLDDRLPGFRNNLCVDEGKWRRVITLFRQISLELEVERSRPGSAEEWREFPGLFLAYSGYHEERILADLMEMLSFIALGHSLFTPVPANWSSGRTLDGSRSHINETIGGADIRLVNVIASAERPGEILARDYPLFQHYGYTAYCRRSWMTSLAADPSVRGPVSAWIESALQRGVSEPLTPESLPVRAWLFARGGPENYRNTEFKDLLEYIWMKAKEVGTLPQFPAPSDRSPDDVFEEFIAGRRSVLMSGSIHDLLVDEWFSVGDDILPLLQADDFQELRVQSRGDLGKNALLFSPRLAANPDLIQKIVEAFTTAWDTLIELLTTPSSQPGVLQYLTTILSPEQARAWRWSFAASDDAILKLMTNEVRPAQRGPSVVVSSPGVAARSVRGDT